MRSHELNTISSHNLHTTLFDFLQARPAGLTFGTPGKAYVTVTANRAPTSGRCFSEPRVGVAYVNVPLPLPLTHIGIRSAVECPSHFRYNTTFVFQCSDWDDDAEDFPLSYEFKFYKNAQVVNLQVKEGGNKVSTDMSAGNHTIVGIVRDLVRISRC